MFLHYKTNWVEFFFIIKIILFIISYEIQKENEKKNQSLVIFYFYNLHFFVPLKVTMILKKYKKKKQ